MPRGHLQAGEPSDIFPPPCASRGGLRSTLRSTLCTATGRAASEAVRGQSVAGRVLVFPTGKGSTVGSYTLYRMAKAGTAPLAILNRESEAIVAVGAIISGIPMVDHVDTIAIQTGDQVRVDGNRVTVER